METLERSIHDHAQSLVSKMHNISTSVDKIGGISAKQIFGGLRQTPLLWYQSSFSNSESGLQFSNSLDELPQSIGEMSKQVNTIEDILWYLLTGHIGTPQSSTLQIIFSRVRTDISKTKNEVNVMLDTIQKDTPILTQLSLALLSLQHRSVHRKAYFTSSKKELWRSTLVDVLEIWNILPYICGTILRRKYTSSVRGRNASVDDKSSSSNESYASVLYDQLIKPFTVRPHQGNSPSVEKNFLTLFVLLHCDHGGGNASAHASHLVASTLSDPYLTLCSGLSALAGPLHGGANADALSFMVEMQKYCQERGNSASAEGLTECIASYTKRHLYEHKKIIPGFGHAVLRVVDPRVTALMNFYIDRKNDTKLPSSGDKNMAFILKAIPVLSKELQIQGKATSPYPNIDSISGYLISSICHIPLLDNNDDQHGDNVRLVSDINLLMFALSRSMGVLAHVVRCRCVQVPLERPDSLTLDQMQAAMARLHVRQWKSKL